MTNRAEIRPAVVTDIPYVYDICFRTGFKGNSAEPYYADRFLLGQYYAAPYVLFSGEFSFILEDPATHVPKGYILGAGDSEAFYTVRAAEWLCHLKAQCLFLDDSKSEFEASLKKTILAGIDYAAGAEDKMLFREYPAHFHVDILPDMQHGGYGHALMNAFLSRLTEKRVEGVHLGVDRDNANACRFYEKEGFSVLQEKDWGFVMGKKLSRTL
jgi:Acetyltransferase (GNAT) family.